MLPHILLLFVFFVHIRSSFQEEVCEGLLKPEVVQSTGDYDNYPASSVLILGETDTYLDNTMRNYWWAKAKKKTTNQGFTITVDKCVRLISGCQIKNLGKKSTFFRATREFRISGSKNENGPWEFLLEDELVNTWYNAASLLDFTFDKPVEIQFLKFELISYWGSNGGGLQYFAAIPATIDCSITTWTVWTLCCKAERKRMRTAFRDGRCRAVAELEECFDDNCPVDCSITTWTEWSICCNGKSNKTRTALLSDQCEAVSEVQECNEDSCQGDNTSMPTVVAVSVSVLLLASLLLLLFCIYKRQKTLHQDSPDDVVTDIDENPVYGDYEADYSEPKAEVEDSNAYYSSDYEAGTGTSKTTDINPNYE